MRLMFWNWIDRRGRIPRWVRAIWPDAHFCGELDELLVLWNWDDCFCGLVEHPTRACRDCGELVEKRMMDEDQCPMCAPPAEFF